MAEHRTVPHCVVALLSLAAICFSHLLAVTTAATICVNDSSLYNASTTSGDGGEYAPVLLVGRYKMKVDSSDEQYQKLQNVIVEQFRMQQEKIKYHRSEEYHRDCEEAYHRGIRTSGVYTIQPDEGFPFQVYCDMDTDSGGWTVFQRRKDGSVDFYRDWMDYARGFGNLTGEFWLGLRYIHRITSISSGAAGNELRVDLGDFEGNTAYAKYKTFAVGSSAGNYRLTVSAYSGTAGDSLAYHNDRPFTTKDEDHDSYEVNCAHNYRGAWWFRNCHESHLNGPYYLEATPDGPWRGLLWFHWKGKHYSLKFTEMKVRRR